VSRLPRHGLALRAQGRPGKRRKAGFTLIEVMVAVSILAVVSTLVWSSFRQTTLTKKNIEAQALRYRTVRLALDRMAREIAMAYLSQNEDTSQPERRTRFVGRRRGGVDELSFSYFGHQRLYEDSAEGDTAVIQYVGEPSRERGAGTNLMRKESRRLGYQKPEDLSGERDVLCDEVVRLKLEYWDARDKQWREEWNTMTADGQPDRLPSKVKITLTVRDERGKEVPFQTQARIFMQEPLNLRAADAPNQDPTKKPDPNKPDPNKPDPSKPDPNKSNPPNTPPNRTNPVPTR
jgi:general secretion pathway protein J